MASVRRPRPSPAQLRRRVDRLAADQRGLVTREQLANLGASRKLIRSLVHQGELIHIPRRRGVYRCGGVPVDWVSMALATVLLAGDGAVASHWTAACLWDLVDRNHPSPRPAIHVTASRQVRVPGVASHRVALSARERAHRHDVPVTSACRTLCDLAGDPTLGVPALGSLVDEALRRGLVRLTDLRAAAWNREARGRPGMVRLRRVLADRGIDQDSHPGANDWELAMDRWWDAAGLPPARRQYRVRTPRRSYVVDRAIIDLRIAVEWNGFDRHGDRTGMDRTSAKELDLASVGWITLPVTSNTPPAAIWRAVHGAISQRRPSDSPTPGEGSGYDGPQAGGRLRGLNPEDPRGLSGARRRAADQRWRRWPQAGPGRRRRSS